jgi:hypothetical protein
MIIAAPSETAGSPIPRLRASSMRDSASFTLAAAHLDSTCVLLQDDELDDGHAEDSGS